jgi:hypothetical protein
VFIDRAGAASNLLVRKAPIEEFEKAIGEYFRIILVTGGYMSVEIRPSKSEVEFLSVAYNSFYDIFEECFEEEFWDKDCYYRFLVVRDAFSIYSELLNYEPLKWVIQEMKTKRPPMESEIGSELFKFIRNVLSHAPFFRCWEDVWINKAIINWHGEGKSIDRFLKKYTGKQEIKYRFWEAKVKQMTYLSISFPGEYNDETKIYLKDILSEKEGVKFALILMKRIIDTQVEDIQGS